MGWNVDSILTSDGTILEITLTSSSRSSEPFVLYLYNEIVSINEVNELQL